MQGFYFEGIHRREGDRDRQLYHREQRNGKADGKGFWNFKVHGAYGCGEIERFVWVVI